MNKVIKGGIYHTKGKAHIEDPYAPENLVVVTSVREEDNAVELMAITETFGGEMPINDFLSVYGYHF